MRHGQKLWRSRHRSTDRGDRKLDVTDLREYSGTRYGVVSQEVKDSADPVHARDVLDEAVRRLAISPMPLPDRLSMAGEALRAGLTRRDFVEREDRRLFERIVEALGELQDSSETEMRRRGEGVLEELARDVVDLRDAVIGRAIRRSSRPPDGFLESAN
jgi:hypothetical protein